MGSSEATDYSEMAIALLEQGNEVNTVIALLKEDGATASECITALSAIGIDRKDSQRLVAASPAWEQLFRLARDNRN